MRLPKLVSMGCFMVLSLFCSGLYLQSDWASYQQLKRRWETLKPTQRSVREKRHKKNKVTVPMVSSLALLMQSLQETSLGLHRLVVLDHSTYRLESRGQYAAYLNWLRWMDGAAQPMRYDIKRAGSQLNAVMVVRFDGMPISPLKKINWRDPFHLQISTPPLPPNLTLIPIRALNWVGFAGANAVWQLPSGSLQTAATAALLGQEACQSERLDERRIRLTCPSIHRVLIKELT